jgi:hypothetical protein
MTDQELITAVRQSVHGVRMNVPAEQIASRSRAIRASGHRRLAASITAVATAGSVVLGLGLSGALRAAPNGGTGTIRTAAFTLTRNASGTATLIISPFVLIEPRILRHDLSRYGIQARVRTGSFCSSKSALRAWPQVMSFSPRSKGPGQHLTITIKPSAMPAGTELSFGDFRLPVGRQLDLALIKTNSHTCTSTAPTATPADGAAFSYFGPAVP